jgi:hypothetical protein
VERIASLSDPGGMGTHGRRARPDVRVAAVAVQDGLVDEDVIGLAAMPRTRAPAVIATAISTTTADVARLRGCMALPPVHSPAEHYTSWIEILPMNTEVKFSSPTANRPACRTRGTWWR